MTLDQAKQYLDSLGVTFPDFVIEAIIEQISANDECLESNYSKSTTLLIKCYLLALIGGAQSGKYISNRGLSGGLYQGFTYKDSGVLFRSQLSLLRSLDKKSCMTDLIPESPFENSYGMIKTIRAKCYE